MSEDPITLKTASPAPTILKERKVFHFFFHTLAETSTPVMLSPLEIALSRISVGSDQRGVSRAAVSNTELRSQ